MPKSKTSGKTATGFLPLSRPAQPRTGFGGGRVQIVKKRGLGKNKK